MKSRSEKNRSDSSGISFTALYTGAVWHRHGLSDDSLATARGRWLYHLMRPFEAASKLVAGGNLRTFLLQRHLIIDQLIDRAIADRGITQVLEIACGMSPRGIRLRQRYPHLHVIEADLPDMAARKALRLMAAERLGPHHQVTPIDILADTGEYRLEAVAERVLDLDKPFVVVTEGLTSYFPLRVIDSFWQRLAALVTASPGSVYLSETYRMPAQPALRQALRASADGLGRMTRSQVSFHFENDRQAREHLLAQGFGEVTVHNPADYYDSLAIPHSRQDPFVRVLEATS
ncbi:MAG: class I SAM-dependent methyltransferase [Marinobacter sp.]|uniref:class I SAM-dependent methyltransferase n=1 Tax=Marinobacter sp. TaxID=50741 RepID=UPI00299E3F62|nr:class I SAM-dependent methyltransferase [Marinobacter sp.]MDX1633483.1 class I SAM-dependent methyltransferase [Marinobacter sp.]